MVDPLHFANIIKNLVENSYKYSNDNPVIDIYTANIDGGILISVVDQGIGIAPENQKYIFDKFYRVPTGNVHDVKGTGIGLYYVKIMTEAHGGSITVQSELGKGSRFNIFLPFQ
jgi:two-component system phosphate regulon sensor histidine kinase PhoR